MTKSVDQRDPVEMVAEEFALRFRQGEQPSVNEYVKKYPEHADAIREALPAVAMMEQLKRRKEAASSPGSIGKKIERLGDFVILREIGRGGMGVVYEARQQSLQRRVALKVLPRTALLDSKKLERFQREAQAAARLHHTNIVPVFGVGHDEGVYYYVMQCIDGSGLDAVLARLRQQHSLRDTLGPADPTPQTQSMAGLAVLPPPLPPSRTQKVSLSHGAAKSSSTGDSHGLNRRHWRYVAQLGLQVATALQYAHEQGILHRDIKPANLIVDAQHTVWVTDFGLAKHVDDSDLTKTGDIIGTLQYMAPETLQGEVDARSDIYSLGLTLYELITLRSPFPESNPIKLLEQVSQRSPTPPRKVNAAIPRDLETIVLSAVASVPKHRYQSAGALAEDLRRFLEDRPIQARRTAALERAWRWARRNPGVATLSVTSLASLLLAAVVGWVGYANTQAALRQESQRRDEAVAAQAKADANVALSLAAFEDIFNQLTVPDVKPRRERGGEGPPGGWEEEARDNTALLESIIGFYHRFAEQNTTNATLQREAAKANRRIGDLQRQLGHADEAAIAYQRAQRIYTSLAAEKPDEPSYRYEMALTAVKLAGEVSRAPAADAPEQLQQALAIGESLFQLDSQAPEHLELLGLVHGQLGLYYDHKSDLKSAERELVKAVESHERLAELYPRRLLHAVQLGHARGDLADFYVRNERPNDAQAALETSTAALLRENDRQGPRPQRDGRVHELLVSQFDELARILKQRGNTEQAAAVLRQSDDLGPPPPRRPPGRHLHDDEPQHPDDPPPRRVPRNDPKPPDDDGPPREGRRPRPEDRRPPDGRHPLPLPPEHGPPEHGPPEHGPPRR